ncbi:MAG TPA: hypothetical protein VLT90_15320 [Terriglobales bacterium]|nr:hypothetical protein [Methylomirabilota bacterium]HUM06835.1 hypothetical protein [Terriglobales bacterium]
MHRWTAKLLVLVMLVPAFGPLALARASQSMGSHCQRQAARPAMECHHGVAMAPEPQSPEASFRAINRCCDDHACCRGLATLRWAEAERQFSVDPAKRPEIAPLAAEPDLIPAVLNEADSARAPPLA